MTAGDGTRQDPERWGRRWAVVAGVALVVGAFLPTRILTSLDPGTTWKFPDGMRLHLNARWSCEPLAGMAALALGLGRLRWRAGVPLLVVAVAYFATRGALHHFAWNESAPGWWVGVLVQVANVAPSAVAAGYRIRARGFSARHVRPIAFPAGLLLVAWVPFLYLLVVEQVPLALPAGTAARLGPFTYVAMAMTLSYGVLGLLAARRVRKPDVLGSLAAGWALAMAVLLPLLAVAGSWLFEHGIGAPSADSVLVWGIEAVKRVAIHGGMFVLGAVAIAAVLEARLEKRAIGGAGPRLDTVFE